LGIIFRRKTEEDESHIPSKPLDHESPDGTQSVSAIRDSSEDIDTDQDL
jgi:hypothetical protein